MRRLTRSATPRHRNPRIERTPAACLRDVRAVGLAMALSVGLMLGGCPPPNPGGNSAPAAEDRSAAATSGLGLSISLLATDPNGDALTFIVLSLPASGVLSDPDGEAIAAVPHTLAGGGNEVRYTATPGFGGEDSFTYAASDGQVQSAAATVTITVTELEPDVTYDQDTTVASLSIEPGRAALIANNAVLTVTGDATIDGTIFANAGRIRMIVEGALTVNGTIQAFASTEPAQDDVPLAEQTAGLYLVVGGGAVTIGSAAILSSDGPIVVTDDETLLARTPSDLYDEVENVGGDDLPTFVPLPPDNPVFVAVGGPKVKQGPVLQGVPLAPITVGGVWPPVGAPPPRGDRPILILHFDGPRDVILDGWTVNGPGAPAGASADQSGSAGNNASGARGRNGLRLNLRNEGGQIRIVNNVNLNLANGGDGGAAKVKCATATGGAGGDSGNFRMTADEGIDVSEGTLTINPGRGGNGGRATVDADVAGNAGCPGNNGQAGTATGGRGGNNEKRLFVRGDVAGLENVIIGPLSGGNGGTADVVSCAGGSGLPCCDGGTGGAATSTGGAGGAASLVAAVFGVTTGAVTGGNGGEATSFANDGGDGGSCKLDDGGNGGNGGASTATGGTGGAAVSDGGGATGGNGGDASAFGGDGANGGDSGLGSPGSGGDGGVARATEGAGGAGTTAGTPGTPVQLDGIPGTDGGDIDVVLYCLDLRFLVLPSGLLDPGTYEGPVTDADTGAQIGVVSVTLANEVGGSLLSSTTPVEHIGLAGATLDVDVTSLQLEMPTAGVISGLQINPLYGTNVSSSHPLEVQALNAAGTLIDSRSITTVPDNSSHTETPTPVNAEFDVSESVATFRVVVDPQSFVTLFRIYLVDP